MTAPAKRGLIAWALVALALLGVGAIPPNLAQEDMQAAPRAFWIIKHGIKMSAMPAWGKTLDDAAIWEMVAFVQKMPDMAPETYAQLSQGHWRE